jgi:hypothetical protein
VRRSQHPLFDAKRVRTQRSHKRIPKA